jgi:hypothetical protein
MEKATVFTGRGLPRSCERFLKRLKATDARCERCRRGEATRGNGAEVFCRDCDTAPLARRSAARRAIHATKATPEDMRRLHTAKTALAAAERWGSR